MFLRQVHMIKVFENKNKQRHYVEVVIFDTFKWPSLEQL